MKQAFYIIITLIVWSCGGGKNNDSATANDAVATKASEMTDGASDQEAPASTAKKYDIKSGIVTYNTVMRIGDMELLSKKVVYFDDYGVKECQEIYKADGAGGKEVLTERSFVKDGFRYHCSVENKGGAKSKAMGTGVAVQFNMQEASTMTKYQFKKLDDETVCGKACNGFSMVTPSGVIKMYGWNKVTLKSRTENAEMKMASEDVAVKFEENVPIPPEVFEVPQGVAMTDM
jgi:hypothetical protein